MSKNSNSSSPTDQPTNTKLNNNSSSNITTITEILPKAGLVYSEKGNSSEILNKPKILPIKSITLEKIELMVGIEEARERERESCDEKYINLWCMNVLCILDCRKSSS
jgi:hypothetical protein